MDEFLIIYENEEALKSLEKFGEITYKSRVINLAGIRTQYNKEELMNIHGVTKVTEDRFGRLL